MFQYHANPLQWIDTEMKGAELEKFKGRVFLSVDPHLFSLHLFSLPVNLSLSLASPVCFHISYSPSFIQKYLYYLFLFAAVVSVTHSLSATHSLQVSSRSTEAWLDSNESSESYRHRQALSFTYCNYVGSGPCTHNWYDSRENRQRLLVLQVTGY